MYMALFAGEFIEDLLYCQAKCAWDERKGNSQRQENRTQTSRKVESEFCCADLKSRSISKVKKEGEEQPVPKSAHSHANEEHLGRQKPNCTGEGRPGLIKSHTGKEQPGTKGTPHGRRATLLTGFTRTLRLLRDYDKGREKSPHRETVLKLFRNTGMLGREIVFEKGLVESLRHEVSRWEVQDEERQAEQGEETGSLVGVCPAGELECIVAGLATEGADMPPPVSCAVVSVSSISEGIPVPTDLILLTSDEQGAIAAFRIDLTVVR
ncbi:hypothetical protein OE88DRAFT_1646803 [Heliocybe sulcata]|uniref:Uncharacterized protein n=1 Tax=Heliocybe sulcata TaxID=5364 RepID=A0A5C3MWX5_9AGAM|nr:hypothetical protein OE88DRAFT_1646803 [Heliocybe sulcata]